MLTWGCWLGQTKERSPQGLGNWSYGEGNEGIQEKVVDLLDDDLGYEGEGKDLQTLAMACDDYSS